MRSRPLWKVLKRMMPHDQSRIRIHHLHARHPRVTIGIDEVNIARDKDVLIIRASRCENQRAENCDFENAQDSAKHLFIPNL